MSRCRSSRVSQRPWVASARIQPADVAFVALNLAQPILGTTHELVILDQDRLPEQITNGDTKRAGYLGGGPHVDRRREGDERIG